MAPELRPRRSARNAAPADAATVQETPKSKPKTPQASKRKATEDVSPAATKKQKGVKTPSKTKESEGPSAKEAEPTPKAKKAKTPAKSKDIEDTSPKEAEPSTQPKKTKTPVKSEQIEEAEQQEKTPASKAKKNKTPAKSKEPEETLKEAENTPASKEKKEKTPAKAKEVEQKPSEAAEKTPASKSKKEKTPAKAKAVKDTPSKITEQTTSQAVEKQTPEAASKSSKQTPASNEKTPKKTPKSANKSAKKSDVEQPVEQKEEAASEAKDDEHPFSDEELDEQTKALVQTVDNEEDDGPGSGIVLFEQGQDVGKVPELSKKQQKKAKKALAAAKDKETGVIYVGRLPHGFYEHEMRSYFSQFGPIRNLRVSRNKKTGKAKHFAFVEFEELSTAEIVAKTMDSYLLFGHILKCSVIPKAQVHEDLFKGGNKRFKPVPWNKMEGKQMERPILESKWERKIAKEKKRRAERAKKLEAVGYEFSAPAVMDVDSVPAITAPDAAAQEPVKAIEEAPTKAIEAPPAAEVTEKEVDEKEQEATPQPAKRGRGRPAKTPQKATKAAATPRKSAKSKA